MNVKDVLHKSYSRLSDSSIHPLVRYKAQQLVIQSFQAGVPIIITQGYRSIAYQNQLYAQGRTAPGAIVTKAKGGRSMHNYGLAVDIALLLPDGKTASWDTRRDGDKDSKRDWFEAAAIGKRLKFAWGGDWDHFIDMPHFEYPFGVRINELQTGKRPPALTATEANVIIETELQPAWKAAHEKDDKPAKEVYARIADELRAATGQPKQNG